MRYVFLFMLIISTITPIGKAQQWQTLLSLDSRLGYSTNSYLNPFLSEWNDTSQSSYNLTSLIGRSYWYKNGHSMSLTGGLFYEPLFQQNENWKGGLGTIDYNYRFTNHFSAGVETGASYMTNSYSRTMLWIQPKVTWFITSFTLLRLKAGSNVQNYQDNNNSRDHNHYDLYGLEFETWPSYRWRLTAGLYGSLDALPSVKQGFNARTSAGYYFRNGASLSLNLGLEQYQTKTSQQTGGVASGPPQSSQLATTVNTDRIMRLSLDGSYPINEQFSVFASAEALRFTSESSSVTTNDVEFSGGVRFSFEPRFNKNRAIVTPEWKEGKNHQQIKIRYSGKGRLYLVGDFNNWKRTGIPLREQSDNVYVTQLSLNPGAYEYKVLRIQGDTKEWLTFSDDTYTVSDGYGSKNAMLLVEE